MNVIERLPSGRRRRPHQLGLSATSVEVVHLLGPAVAVVAALPEDVAA